MRTTVTLDPDVMEQVKALALQRGLPFKVVLNEVLRAGLAKKRGSAPRSYRVPARPLGLKPGLDLTQALRLADALEDEETARKLERRK